MSGPRFAPTAAPDYLSELVREARAAVGPAGSININVWVTQHTHNYSFRVVEQGAVQYISKLLASGLASSGPSLPPGAGGNAAWSREVAHFRALLPKLLADAAYRNKFVAIKDGRVVDVDESRPAVAARLYERYPGEVVFVGRVQRGIRSVRLPSPKVAR